MKEKMIELLMQKGFGVEGATIAADHLIANGVTIPMRCKDCHWWWNINKKNGCGICSNEVFYIDDPTTAPVTEPYDFCSYGERMSNGIKDDDLP